MSWESEARTLARMLGYDFDNMPIIDQLILVEINMITHELERTEVDN